MLQTELIKYYGTYFILDAARIFDKLSVAQQLQSSFVSLYKGQSMQSLGSVAPYLFSYKQSSEFSKWVFENGQGNSWGIFLECSLSIENLQGHLRKFLLVKIENDKEFYFRFYDPRVLKIFLPTCDKSQILEFFGPIESFICEGETKNDVIRFWQENGILKQEILSVEKVFGDISVTQELP